MKSKASFIRIIGFAILGYLVLNWLGTTADTSMFIEQPLLLGIYVFLVFFHIAGEVCLAALQAILFKTLSEEKQKKYLAKEALRDKNRFKWFRDTYKRLLGSKAIEEEHEIILDHDYDGIKELDNDLPPWWTYSFYATIVFAVVYLVRFEVFNDYSQVEEYEVAVAEAKIEIEAWKKSAKNLVDVNTVTLLRDASDLNAGQKIFNAHCIACHKADGGGGIGPNLTDKHWILGGGIKNVFNTISEGGRDGKGMISWKSDLKPAEIAQVASYVLSFQGTTPAEPKKAEGEIWIDPDAPEAILPKATETVKDSSVVEVVISNLEM
ncbi:cbb3-type cytochrome c oxidase N-terminal domain-containing protein [uncultured Algibacter sp.]|uniref:cbb3-type cytochrome c oxidase N-terminal domain-containing protein n=1 Tax=uncultured Algibacter sp. TaxID=298659 RepID=UPI003217860E